MLKTLVLRIPMVVLVGILVTYALVYISFAISETPREVSLERNSKTEAGLIINSSLDQGRILPLLIDSSSEETIPRGPILLNGFMASEARSNRILLQATVIPAQSGHLGVISPPNVRFVYSQAERDFEKYTKWTRSDEDLGYTVRAEISDLNPATEYSYWVEYGPSQETFRRGPEGRFSTLAGRSYAAQSIVFFACFETQGYYGANNADALHYYAGPEKKLGFSAVGAARFSGANFAFFMGDNVYFDAPAEWAATSEKSMRERYRELVELPYLTSILAAMPSYWMKDDHDHRFNNSDPHAAGQPSHKSALKIFREQVPIKPDNSDVGGVTYRKILFNEDLELWILEGRDHRSPNSQQDGPLKTILGFKQREWLFKSLKESDARFKVIVSATPIFGPARAASNDNHATSDGFQFEGKLIQNFLKDNFEPDEVIVIGADTHWLSHVENKFGFHEFLVGSVGELIVRPERGSDRLSPPPIDNIDHYLDKQNLGFLKLNNYRNGAEAKLEIQLINAFGTPLYNYVIGYD